MMIEALATSEKDFEYEDMGKDNRVAVKSLAFEPRHCFPDLNPPHFFH